LHPIHKKKKINPSFLYLLWNLKSFLADLQCNRYVRSIDYDNAIIFSTERILKTSLVVFSEAKGKQNAKWKRGKQERDMTKIIASVFVVVSYTNKK
jgi:hypothetical protein